MISAFFAKLIAIFSISVTSFIAGILPALFGIGNNCQRSVILSVVLCFGCGVLLATAMVHILPETRESLNQWAEVVFCIGFFGFYMLDLFVQILTSPFVGANPEEVAPLNRAENSNDCVRNYGTDENQPPANARRRNTLDQLAFDGNQACSATRVGLLFAFTMHALLEGLIIGVQTSPKSVFLLLGALACHKVVVTFCLGAEFSSGVGGLRATIPPLMVYVIGSALGITIGMFLHEYQADPKLNLSLPILQGIAGGTLLYIVVSEILPRERARDLPVSASLLQLIALIVGFSLLVAINSIIDF